MKKGVVYACSHTDWMPETVRSALSFAKHMPDIERHFFAPLALLERCRQDLPGAFTKVFSLGKIRHAHRPRFESMLAVELDRMIFIDGDTLLLAPVYELFEILEHFDIAASIAPQLFNPLAMKSGLYDALPKVSMAIPEWNGGLLVAKNTEQFRAFVKSWNALFNQCLKRGYALDQASFRSALAISRLRVATLAHNYNFRAHVQQIVRGQVRILHAHGELDEIAKTVNATPVMRHYVPQENLIHGYRPPKAPDL